MCVCVRERERERERGAAILHFIHIGICQPLCIRTDSKLHTHCKDNAQITASWIFFFIACDNRITRLSVVICLTVVWSQTTTFCCCHSIANII